MSATKEEMEKLVITITFYPVSYTIIKIGDKINLGGEVLIIEDTSLDKTTDILTLKAKVSKQP